MKTKESEFWDAWTTCRFQVQGLVRISPAFSFGVSTIERIIVSSHLLEGILAKAVLNDPDDEIEGME